MRKNLEKKVRAYCDRHQMLQKGDGVVVGVSGGADSVCLLFVLLALREELDLKLHVVHVNHGIRTDAGEDAAYVKEICHKYELPFYLVERDIPAEAAGLNCSEEEAGRRARYQAFEEIKEKQHCQKIAVAHNSNDRAETMLFHLFRGTGLTGLASIRPVRDEIIRPILCLERAEIEQYLDERQIAFRHDSTNDSDDYTRNKIRHHILPYAQEEIVTGCVTNMVRTADILAETENYIEEQVQSAIAECVTQKPDNSFCIDRKKYLRQHTVIQKRLLLALLKQLSPMRKDITSVHVEDIHSLFVEEGNRCIHLPYGIRGNRVYEEIRLERVSPSQTGKVLPGQAAPDNAGERSSEQVIPNGRGKVSSESVARPATEATERQRICVDKEKITQQENKISLPGCGEITLKNFSYDPKDIKTQDIPQNKYTKWLDYDKIVECLEIRTRREGDYLCIKGSDALQHKKLKDYMITEKIPRLERDRIPVLAEGNHILWLIGYRISEYYKVSANTKHILQITYEPYEAE